MRIVEAAPSDVAGFMEREWAPENLRRFGRDDAEMWEKTRGYAIKAILYRDVHRTDMCQMARFIESPPEV